MTSAGSCSLRFDRLVIMPFITLAKLIFDSVISSLLEEEEYQAILSEPPSLAHPMLASDKATRDGVHPLGEPKLLHGAVPTRLGRR
jgi:hypothetical protein